MPPVPNIGTEGVKVLASSPILGRLEQLSIDNNLVDGVAIEALLGNPALDNLKHLSIETNECYHWERESGTAREWLRSRQSQICASAR